MTSHISAAMRDEVRRRAGDRCEYCLIQQSCVTSAHQVAAEFLQLNVWERLIERQEFIQAGLYGSP